jgi:hypothetical protein
MAPLTYPPSGWQPSGNLGTGSLLQPQTLTAEGLTFYSPRTIIGQNEQSYNYGQYAGALPICFNKNAKLWNIVAPYEQNIAESGTTVNGVAAVNPGWQVRAYFYSSNTTTGLPENYLFSSSTGTLAAGTGAGRINMDINPDYIVSANTPIWVVVVGQPQFVAELPDGWDITVKYKKTDGVWAADETGGFVFGPRYFYQLNQLAPISNLPKTSQLVTTNGNIYGGNNAIAYLTHAPFKIGATPALNIATATPPSSWPSYTVEWPVSSGNQHTYNHIPTAAPIPAWFINASETTF